MKQYSLLFIFLCSVLQFYAQNEEVTVVSDSLYKEDQFYIAATYNFLGNKPNDLSQSGFSSGFHLGFIKDMPINKRRNVAIGLGIGLSSNAFNQNMLIDKDVTGIYQYSILSEENTAYTKNKFVMYLIDVPLEFRWRTSTTTQYKFWRIYSGLKFSYVLANTSKFKGGTGQKKFTNIQDFNNFQYGLTLSAGYNTWNLHLYYALNPIFSNSARINGNAINMNAIKIGLIFYIL